MWMFYSEQTRLNFTMKNFNFDSIMIWRIVKIGIPTMTNGTGRTLVSMVLTCFISPFGTYAVADQSLM